MSNNSLPAHLLVRLNLLRSDPEIRALLEALKADPKSKAPFQRYSPSATGSSQKQLNRFVYQSGYHDGWEMLFRVLTSPERETQ